MSSFTVPPTIGTAMPLAASSAGSAAIGAASSAVAVHSAFRSITFILGPLSSCVRRARVKRRRERILGRQQREHVAAAYLDRERADRILRIREALHRRERERLLVQRAGDLRLAGLAAEQTAPEHHVLAVRALRLGRIPLASAPGGEKHAPRDPAHS